MARRRDVILGLAAASASGAAQAVSKPYWPERARWEVVAPNSAGLDRTKLDTAVQTALADRSASVLVLRGGRIAAERYAPGVDPTRPLEIASAGKSIVAVLVGAAIDRGLIKGVDQSAADFIPQWRDTPKAAITLRHILSMTSGLDIRGLKDRGVAGDQFEINAAAALRDPPGTRWAYATPIYHLLFHILARAAGEPFEAFADKALIGPLELGGTSWVTGAGTGTAGPVTNYYSARCTARDLARFGLMALRGGVWRERRIVSADFLRKATSPSQDLNPAYGWLWWENARPGFAAGGARDAANLRFPGSPPDTFAALGAGGQVVIVSPSLHLVVVRQGQAPSSEATLPALMAGVIAASRRES